MSKKIETYALQTKTNGCSPGGYFRQSHDSLLFLSQEIRRFITLDAKEHRYKNKSFDCKEYIDYIRKYFQNTKIVKIKKEISKHGLQKQNYNENLSSTIIETMVDYYLVVMIIETLDSNLSRCISKSDIDSPYFWSGPDCNEKIVFELLSKNYKENKTLTSPSRQFFLGNRSSTFYQHAELSENLFVVRKFLRDNKIKHKKDQASSIAALFWIKDQSDLNYAKLFFNENEWTIVGDLTFMYQALEYLKLSETRTARLIDFIHRNHFTVGNVQHDVWLSIDGVNFMNNQKLLFLP